MGKFSDLSKEEQLLVISVPYRIGIWISMIDDNEQTGRDDKREKQALEMAIGRMASAHRKMPFAANIMKSIEKCRGQWSAWDQQSSEGVILKDAATAIDLCQSKLGSGATKQYKHALWQIGMIVAQSFGEHIDPDNEMHVDHFFQWVGGFFSAPKLQKAPENLSEKEKIALKKLRAILKEQVASPSGSEE
jgi:hypothetical protein